jgi:hypothetical protein
VPNCPRCHQVVASQAIVCPHCQMKLKAFGHPGMTLYRATGQESLCETCLYHEDDSCNFPQRPDAKECTLYTDRTKPLVSSSANPYPTHAGYSHWLKRNLVWVALLGLILLSVLLTILR